jgi:hypothetical protein
LTGREYLAAHAVNLGIAKACGAEAREQSVAYRYTRSDGSDFRRVRHLTGRLAGRTLWPKDQEPVLYWPTGRHGGAILLAEGEPDALAAVSALRAEDELPPVLNRVAVAAVPGSMKAQGAAEELRDAGATLVYLALDGDPAGHKAADRLADALADIGIEAHRVVLPDGLDLAELLVGSEAPTQALGDLLAEAEASAAADLPGDEQGVQQVRIATASDFAAAEEAGADPLLGESGEVVIPQGGDVVLYGDGGASKTTLSIDLACHLAAGDSWLSIPAPRPVKVLLIEAEGPRPLFREKLRRKLKAWSGSNLGDRLQVLAAPWADFRFDDPKAGEVAGQIGESEIDVLIVGPLTRIGMDGPGTLQEVSAFMRLVAEFRARSGRPLAVIVVHHENKGGAVSGAWEGAADTLLHAQVHSRGRTRLDFQKTRWSPRWHKQQLDLDWTDGEGFRLTEEPARDLLAEVEAWLRSNPYSTAAEVATRKAVKRADGTEDTVDGIGANETAVVDLLNSNPARFRLRNGAEARAVGRHPSARCWELRGDGPPALSADPGVPTPAGVGPETRSAGPPTLKGADQLPADLPPTATTPLVVPADLEGTVRNRATGGAP